MQPPPPTSVQLLTGFVMLRHPIKPCRPHPSAEDEGRASEDPGEVMSWWTCHEHMMLFFILPVGVLQVWFLCSGVGEAVCVSQVDTIRCQIQQAPNLRQGQCMMVRGQLYNWVWDLSHCSLWAFTNMWVLAWPQWHNAKKKYPTSKVNSHHYKQSSNRAQSFRIWT